MKLDNEHSSFYSLWNCSNTATESVHSRLFQVSGLLKASAYYILALWTVTKYDDLQTCPTPSRTTYLWCNLYAYSDCPEQPVAHAALFQSPFQRHEQVLLFSYNNQEKCQRAVTSHTSYVNTALKQNVTLQYVFVHTWNGQHLKAVSGHSGIS